jgi:hypothetical protein
MTGSLFSLVKKTNLLPRLLEHEEEEDEEACKENKFK